MVVVIATTIPITSGTEMPRYIKPVASFSDLILSSLLVTKKHSITADRPTNLLNKIKPVKILLGA
jgi:hypothetical protein